MYLINQLSWSIMLKIKLKDFYVNLVNWMQLNVHSFGSETHRGHYFVLY